MTTRFLVKRFFLSVLASLIFCFGFANSAQAVSLNHFPHSLAAVAAGDGDVIEQLKTQLLPQIEKILTPAQQEKLQTVIIDGESSLRKAFKSLTLTPEQKGQMASMLKALPKKEIFTSMTAAQKRAFFMKKKDLFMPTAEEIAGYKAMKDK